MKIYVVVLDKVFDTGLSTILDTFGVANALAASVGTPSTNFEVTMVGVRSQVTTNRGLSVPVVSAKELERPDIVVIPGIGEITPEPLKKELSRPDLVDAEKIVKKWSGEGTLTGAACTGTFVLAGMSLLDGVSATTNWWLAPLFRERYPQVKLEDSRMVVGSSNFVTAGSALAHIDLALWLVRRSSPTLAIVTAQFLVSDPRSSQSAYMIPEYLAHSDPVIERFEKWARQNLSEGFSLRKAAASAGTSERTLARRLQTILGKTPLSYFQEIRIEYATHLLRTSKESVDQIASKVGYANGKTLRRLISRKLDRTVSEIRALN